MKRHAVRTAALLFASVALAQSPAPALPSPAKSGFVTANGIRLHYLDWGGTGETILFLPGFNDTAHVYDHFAPVFTDHFHVIGQKMVTTRVRESKTYETSSINSTSHASSSSDTQWLAMS
jgi:hypothetical protein